MMHAGIAEQNCWKLIGVASIVKVWEQQKQAQQFYLYSWCCLRGQRIKDCQCQARLWDGQSQLNVMWLWDWPVWTRMMVQLGAKFFVKFDWLEKSETCY